MRRWVAGCPRGGKPRVALTPPGPAPTLARVSRGRAGCRDPCSRRRRCLPVRRLGAPRVRPPVRAQRTVPRVLPASWRDARDACRVGGRPARPDGRLPHHRSRLRSRAGDVPHQRDHRGGGLARAPPRPASRSLPRLGPGHVRALPAARRRPAARPAPPAATAAAARLVAGAHVRVGRRGARHRRGMVRRCGRARRRTDRRAPARGRSVGRGGAARGSERGLRAAVRRRAGVPARARQPSHGHRRIEGHAAPAIARRLPAHLLDAARNRRLLLRERVRHDRALLAALRERAPRSFRRPQPRHAPPRRAALAAHPGARSRHPRAGSARRDRPALPPRPRQRRLGLRGADRGPRPQRGRRRHRARRTGAGGAAARLRDAPGGARAVSSTTDLARAVASARAAAARMARRPRRDVARALAAAARRWCADRELREALPPQAGLSPPVVAAGLDAVARTLDADAMVALVERELGSQRPTGGWLVGHVTASNVPALGVSAIVLTCLAGAAAVVKSGRADRLSAPAFHRALEAEDAELAGTIVTTYWSGGDAAAERGALATADVVICTGRDETVESIAQRYPGAVVAHGERTSLAVIGDAAIDDATVAERVARDVALHDQRGCLSPVAVHVTGDAHAFAERLVAALDALADVWPPGPLTTAERAAHRSLVAEAEWAGADVLDGAGGTVLVHDDPRPRPCPGRRTVWVHPLACLSQAVQPGRVECVGVAGASVDIEALRRLGVSRVCDAGTMQRPRLSWPRGQHAPLRTLLRLPAEPRLEVDLA